jgi:hypothetical protein
MDLNKAAFPTSGYPHNVCGAQVEDRPGMAIVAGAAQYTPERDVQRTTSLSDARRRTAKLQDNIRRQHRFQRRAAASSPAVRRAARSASAKLQRRQLCRRETPEALAQQMLRKIDVLRRGYMAYKAHFEGANAVMLQHLNDPDSYGADLPSEERQRLAALKKDYVAWLTYTNTGELPQRVHSAGMDLPMLQPGTYQWLEYLTPQQRQRFTASLTAHREFQRLSKRRWKREVWLAKDDGRGVRQAVYELMRKGYSVGEVLRKTGERAMKAAGVTKQPAPKARATPQTNNVLPKQKQNKEWMQYLDDDDRARVDALLPSFNAYKRHIERPTERDAWLAAEGEEGARRRALYDALHESFKEYQRLFHRAKSNMKFRRREAAVATEKRELGAEGKTGGLSDKGRVLA